MTPDMLEIYISRILKITQEEIAARLRKKGINATQNQVARTISGDRPNLHLRKPIEEVIERPGAFDHEFDAVIAARKAAERARHAD